MAVGVGVKNDFIIQINEFLRRGWGIRVLRNSSPSTRLLAIKLPAITTGKPGKLQ